MASTFCGLTNCTINISPGCLPVLVCTSLSSPVLMLLYSFGFTCIHWLLYSWTRVFIWLLKVTTIYGWSTYMYTLPNLIPSHLPLCILDYTHDLWTAWRSGRRPGSTPTSSNCKVDSIMTLDSVSLIMAMCPRARMAIDSKRHKTTLPVYSYDTKSSTLDATLSSGAVVRHTLTFEYSESGVPDIW